MLKIDYVILVSLKNSLPPDNILTLLKYPITA